MRRGMTEIKKTGARKAAHGTEEERWSILTSKESYEGAALYMPKQGGGKGGAGTHGGHLEEQKERNFLASESTPQRKKSCEGGRIGERGQKSERRERSEAHEKMKRITLAVGGRRHTKSTSAVTEKIRSKLRGAAPTAEDRIAEGGGNLSAASGSKLEKAEEFVKIRPEEKHQERKAAQRARTDSIYFRDRCGQMRR